MKEVLAKLYKDHIEWLEPHDHLSRATNGFKSAVEFMMSNDNSSKIKQFQEYTNKLDTVRNENTYSNFPELVRLKEYE